MRPKVEEELGRLGAEGTVEPIEYSEWAAPIVALLKSDQKSACLWRLSYDSQSYFSFESLSDP